ncbi:MAG: outer membrane protein transport protein [Deltaproteobacteria bacterium]|nr:outer membrane protein transport protein [Deltaproteobacteria bacterium]
MKKHVIAAVLAFSFILIAQGTARATVADTVGVGGKAVAMGGAFTAIADDFSATWYNPAGVTQPSSIQLSAGLLFINFDLNIDGHPRPIESTGGAYVGLIVPLFHGRGGLGVWGYYPLDLLQRNQFVNPAEPQFGLIENAHQIFDLSPALGFDINSKWSIGAGFRLLSNQSTKLNLFLPIAFNGAALGGTGDLLPVGAGQLVVEAENRISPNVGILWRPYENLKIGATYRYFQQQKFSIENTASTTTVSSNPVAFVNTLLNQDAAIIGEFRGTQFYSPHQVAVGIAYDPSPRLTLSADLVWEGWSSASDGRIEGRNFEPFQFVLGANSPLNIGFRRFINPKPKNIWVPRFGFEWRPKTKKGPLGPVDFQIRGGYAYRPSPYEDNQTGTLMVVSEIQGNSEVAIVRSSGTNFVDAGRHIVSVGLGITIDDPIGWAEKWQFDFWWQQQILRTDTFTNQVFTNIPPQYGEFTQFGNKLRVNGNISAAGAFFTAKF